jgi:hypothetical protein
MNELFYQPPSRKGPVNVTPAKKRPSLSGFIIIRLPPNVVIGGGDLRKREGREKLPGLASLLKKHSEVVTQPVVRSVDPYQLRALEKNAELTKFPPIHSLTSYWRLDCRKLKTPIEELLKNIQGLSEVDHAYLERVALDPMVDATDDDYAGDQDYLDAAPVGIGARWAWTQANGEGAGVGFVDLEEDWNLHHEDLAAKGPTLSYGDNRYVVDGFSGDHGTAVLGTVVGIDNAVGIVGIAPAVSSVRVVSRYEASDDSAESDVNVASAIAHAVSIMAPGDVLLLEVQRDFLPTETDEVDFHAIRLASSKNIIVVEAAGNGNANLDAWTNDTGLHLLDRANWSSDALDSGAIMVGSCKSALPHNRLVGLGAGTGSNYGSRLDCFAWGEDIVTTGYGHINPAAGDDQAYTDDFGGTSGAAAIIAGAALILQGMYQETPPRGGRISPTQMRALLSDPTTGTPQGAAVAGHIGIMPDLCAIIEKTIGLTPDVYLRDHVGDTGVVPSTGSISASPDIIVRPTRVANPTASFGEGSGTENSNSLGFEVEAGQDNYVYVRLRNRSSRAAANNTTATIYWSEVSTLVTPDRWHPIGTTVPINVPAGDTLVVTDPIVWRAADIPATGHYCFVGIVNQARDVAPLVPPPTDWDGFSAFIRNQNNVAWRNFNVVNEVADPSFYPFMIAGAPDDNRHFDLEIIQLLPEQAKVVLEVPLDLMKALPSKSFLKADLDRKRKVACLSLPSLPSVPFNNVKLKKGAQFRCRLILKGMNGKNEQEHSVAIRQIFEKQEVGRVTWLFQQQHEPAI